MDELDPFVHGDAFLEHFLPGDAPSVQALRGMIYRLNTAHKNRNMVPSILILGEAGSGKGYTAQLIAAHLWWLRNEQRLRGAPVRISDLQLGGVAADAGLRALALTNLPETLAEVSLFGAKPGAYTDAKEEIIGLFDGGRASTKKTAAAPEAFDVFLDEIGDCPPRIQAKLLEILETRTFRPLGAGFDERARATEARTIFATNKDLSALVEKQEFRPDLYQRLLWAKLELPPLREQLDQLPVILSRINQDLCKRFGLPDNMPSEKEVSWAQTYTWPGNHRELQQVLWEWHLFDGKTSLKEIVERRTDNSGPQQHTLMHELYDRFDAVLAGSRPGFQTYGSMVDEVREIAYTAMYRFNKERQLKDDDLRRLFAEQDPTNVRKQISQNRPKDKE